MITNEPLISIEEKDEKEMSAKELRKVLINAIRMQAEYSRGKIVILQTSDRIN